ncbi:hypothetical protein EJD97_024872 [Solanum chilense]|uniref:Uncharacterized protein n=1 Tax=Solanum chilense TaxID=4083 RepID=A0A6N2C271_SOLCI|nr:hypothetical protein EJD97_024872 [Solanum chilense]
MDESVPPQIEIPPSPVSPFDELLVFSYSLVLYENKSQDSGDESVLKPTVKPVFEKTNVGSMAVSSIVSARLFEGDVAEGKDTDEERKRKGKGKLFKTHSKGEKKRYGTRSVAQMVLGIVMEPNASYN